MNLIKSFTYYAPVVEGDSVHLTFPIIMYGTEGLIELTVSPQGDGYRIAVDEGIFDRINEEPSFYFDHYMKKHTAYTKDMKLADSVIYKDYPENCSPVGSLNEMIRFLISFNAFMVKIVGYESDFD